MDIPCPRQDLERICAYLIRGVEPIVREPGQVSIEDAAELQRAFAPYDDVEALRRELTAYDIRNYATEREDIAAALKYGATRTEIRTNVRAHVIAHGGADYVELFRLMDGRLRIMHMLFRTKHGRPWSPDEHLAEKLLLDRKLLGIITDALPPGLIR